MSPGATDPVSVAVQVTMGAPSFVPGSLVSATVTLRADRSQINSSSNFGSTRMHQDRPYFSSPQTSKRSNPVPSSASLAGFGMESSARADFVVCEVSGRWSSDRSWVKPYAHRPPSNGTLDNHTSEPVAEHAHSHTLSSDGSFPWSAALADANSVGGGGRPGHTGIIFRSQALVVCEREQIPVGSQVSFAVRCVLPDSIPPTLRGTAMRYTYALVVVVSFPGCSAPKVVRVPFRVVSAGGTAVDDDRATHIIPVPTPRSAGPHLNRFLEERESKALSLSASLLKSAPPDDIEIALALSLNGRLTSYKADVDQHRSEDDFNDGALSFIRDSSSAATPKTPSRDAAEENSDGVTDQKANGLSPRLPRRKKHAIPVYGIAHGKEAVARMHLSKRVHHLGDSISAIFHFAGERQCYRLEARLEAQEVIRRDFAVGQKQVSTGDTGYSDVIFRKVYGEHGEFVISNKNTQVTFSIPHDAPVSFSTSIVTVRWLIHFVFLIPRLETEGLGGTGQTSTKGASIEAVSSLGQLRVSENGRAEAANAEWGGGAWSGYQPGDGSPLHQKNVDVLRWTLPIVVSGQPGSQWGTRNVGKLLHEGLSPK
ncbi:unnamed protein product [Chondrus crispus]|uniref:Rgp1-domain-containing protein n=1 Tax=Chondrus crispus TaxID=2769 RepID=R7Q3C5_CHOCR|nr:unnamed protein product [Chondrus crispus]CDF32403.1 unnamed protein product [Chondrus crispus]|eukprot:XP_005712068.1 unnamed protein product [Chondrus crispus]